MNIRPIREEDIEQVIQLFRLNYGDDYAIPEFYDPQWVKRGIYSDHIIWLVIEDEGRVVASGAAILDFGDYNDQVAEIGRLVVDPAVGGKGLGRTLLNALVDASDDRVEFAFGEARTTHLKTQKIFDRVGLVPLGFLPMAYLMSWRESWVLSGQLFGNGRRLREPGSAQLIPEAGALAAQALSNLELEEPLKLCPDVRSYPLYEDQSGEGLRIEPLTGADLVRLLKIEQGRLFEPEVFSGLHIDQGLPSLMAHKAAYLVASEEGQTLGAVGYTTDEASHNVRIIELIARDDAVKGCLLRRAVEEAERGHAAQVIDIDLSASHPRIQQTMLELGFLPVAYVPGLVFHQTGRLDVLKMMKLNVDWELGPLELTESGQAMFDVVAPAFISRDAQHRSHHLASCAAVLEGLTALELDLLTRAAEDLHPLVDTSLPSDGLTILLAGEIRVADQVLTAVSSFGEMSLLTGEKLPAATTGAGAHLLHLSKRVFNDLCDRQPRLGVKLFRNLGKRAG
jgi:RimJ/RimL family protein N-acetyltransferase